MGDQKSRLEIILLPLVIAILGIAGTYFIADQQRHSDDRRAEADREVRILQIFSDKIGGDESDREFALSLLGALPKDLQSSLAAAVEQWAPSEETAALARREVAKASFRQTFIEKSSEPSVGSNSDNGISLCEKYNSYGSVAWKSQFLKPSEIGKWHVFVASLGRNVNQSQAETRRDSFAKQFSQLDFAIMPTVSADGKNLRYAIVLATGIEERAVAMEIARFADTCDIAKGAYPYQQTI